MFTLKSMRQFALVGAAFLSTFGGLYGAPLQTVSNNTANTQKSQQLPPGFTQDEINKLSEAFGHFIGRNLNNPGIHFDLDSIIRGMRSGYAGQPAPMSDQDYEKMMAKLQENAFQQLSQDNLKAADAFIDKNKKVEGVIEIEPGKLQYVILKQGTGPEVKSDSVPQINYVGKYIDGTVFGSSEEVGGPISIPLTQTIKGFSKGIAGMKEGEKRRLFVHPDLGYGTTGQLPPNALLIFDIDVVKSDTPNHKSNSLSSLSDAAKAGKGHGDDDDDFDDDFEEEDTLYIEDEDDDEDFDHHNNNVKKAQNSPSSKK